MAKPIALDAAAVADAVLTNLFHADPEFSTALEAQDVRGMVEGFLAYVDVEYKPTSRKLVLTLDLSGPVVPVSETAGGRLAREDDPAFQD